jgi:hypothetical protein
MSYEVKPINVNKANRFALGLDLGRSVDYTVLAIATFSLQDAAVLRKIERLPLGTTYPKIVDYVILVMKILQEKGEIVSFVWDATGPNVRGFNDFMVEALEKNGFSSVPYQPMVLTGGITGTKLEIISNMRFLFETRQLHFEYPDSDTGRREIDALIEEMRNYEDRRTSPSSDDTSLGVFKTGKHDDMVTACAFAVKDYLPIMKGSDAFVGHIPDDSWVSTPLGNAQEEQKEFFGSIITTNF